MRFNKVMYQLFLFLLVLTFVPSALLAAPVQLSISAKSAFDTMLALAEVKQAASLRQQYSTLLSAQEKEQDWDEQIKLIHYRNEEALIEVRKQIKLINADKINKLDVQVKLTKEKYKPLFESYTSLNQQIKIAKAAKNKELNSLLRSQAEIMKVAVQLARQDIRNKEAALKVAKESTTKTIKKLRNILSNMDPLEVQIKKQRSLTMKPKQRFTTEWRSFNDSVKNGHIQGSANALNKLIGYSKQINEYKQKIYQSENKIYQIIISVKAQIP